MKQDPNISFFDPLVQRASLGELYLTPSRFSESNESRKSAHFMRRAWDKMGLEAILSYDGNPGIYFKKVESFDRAFEANLHRQLWNQGAANLLLVRDGNRSVRVYSAFVHPSLSPVGECLGEEGRLVETLNNVASGLDLVEFIQRVQTGRFYEDKKAGFSQDQAVDETLLRNLRATATRLCAVGGTAQLQRSAAHALLGRLLFTCYLRARGIISDDYLEKIVGIQRPTSEICEDASLNEILSPYSSSEALDVLFKIFTALKKDFNGSLFGDELEGERKAVRSAHMAVLSSFLNGDDLQTGQRALGFPAYDFSLIPIETISAIYEEFLKDEDPKDQDRRGAFYTPRHLAELAVDIATESWNTLLDKKCLDPSCGSGIFLVILFNRMAEEWRFRNPNAENMVRAKALRAIMVKNIWGVDVNPTACKIVCFSLYLAFFDQLEPKDIWQLKAVLERDHNKVLPKLLAVTGDNRQGDGRFDFRILAMNFFQNDLPLPSDFDLVIGNPPWVGRNQEQDICAQEWLYSPGNDIVKSIVKTKSQIASVFLPEKQLACAFMWKSPYHINSKGRVCLLVPTKIWMNEHNNEFQRQWFKKFCVERIIQLSDLRRIIFVNAKCPATIVRYSTVKANGDSKILYDVPKASRIDPRQGRVTILPEDQKIIRTSEIFDAIEKKDVSVVWKMPLWATDRDLSFLLRLRQLPRLGELAGSPEDGLPWMRGEGFKPFRGKLPKTHRWWGDEHLFMDAKCRDLKLVCIPSDARLVGPDPVFLHRSPNSGIFKPPMVLVSDGFSKVAFCDFPVIFTDSLYSIAGKKGDEKYLRFLAAVISSKLAKYYMFHTSANWGSERDKVHRNELLRMPFPLPDFFDESKRALEIVELISDLVAKFQDSITSNSMNFAFRYDRLHRVENEIWPLILEYYQVSGSEKILIDDTINVSILSMTPSSIYSDIVTLRESVPEQRRAYAEQICTTLNHWRFESEFKFVVSAQISNQMGLALMILEKSKVHKDYCESLASVEISNAIQKVSLASQETRVKTAYCRNFTLFEANRALLIKPLALRHWTRTSALNDADTMLAAFLSKEM